MTPSCIWLLLMVRALHITFYIVYDIITSAYLLPYLLIRKPVTSPTEWFSWDPGHITTNQAMLMSYNWMLNDCQQPNAASSAPLWSNDHLTLINHIVKLSNCAHWPNLLNLVSFSIPLMATQLSGKRCRDETTREMKHRGIAILAASSCIMVTDHYFRTSDSDTKHCSVVVSST